MLDQELELRESERLAVLAKHEVVMDQAIADRAITSAQLSGDTVALAQAVLASEEAEAR